MNIRPSVRPLSSHDHLLSLVLSVGISAVEIAVVLQLQISRVEFGNQHTTRRDCDLGNGGMGE